MPFNIDELMTGVGIIIDDAISNDKDKKDDIFKIISQIEEKNIPLVKYSELPDTSVPHFKNVSFILLDWDLNQISSDATEPISVPSGLEESNIEQNIRFIKKIKETCFIPFFIFTKESVDEIINKLEEAGLYSRGKHNFIFVENKSKLKKKNGVFSKVKKWLKETSSIYVLKEWERTLDKAKNELFWDFYILNPDWPKVLWKAYKQDDIDMATEFGELITRNLKTRMSYFGFNEKILDNNTAQIKKEDIMSVIAGERFIPNERLNKNEIYTGDIYKNQNGTYLLNIRPQCDLIVRNDQNIDSMSLYLLEGETVDFPTSKTKLNRIFNTKGGNFSEGISEAILFPIDKSIIKFSFKEQINKLYVELKNNRIGKILPPYITRIQQRYALYLQRAGIPRTPAEAILTVSDGGSPN